MKNISKNEANTALGDRVRIRPGVRLRTLINLRWVAIIGQTSALLIIGLVFQYPFAIGPTSITVMALALLNIALSMLYPRGYQLSSRQAAMQLGFDLIQLATLLYLTGGLANPFTVLILAPVITSATILSTRATLALLGVAFLSLTILALYHQPLPWGQEALELGPTYLAGQAIAIIITTAFVSAYAWRVSHDARRRAQALVATQNALAKEQKLSALGSLAAAAAHELGTPLGTMTLVTKELLREQGQNQALIEDLQLLESQAERCRQILKDLARRAEATDQHFQRVPIAVLVREAAKHYEDMGPELTHTAQSQDGSPGPIVARSPEIMHGLGNYIENAVRFAKSSVHLDLYWDKDKVHLAISDDGPGFSEDILDILGEPYLPSQSGHRDGAKGMGLGIFIASTLLDRTGANTIYLNDVTSGAIVDITWDRQQIEEEGGAWDIKTT